MKRLQIIETPFFMDLLSMDPGDRWEKKLYEKIGDCDLFLLFWSQAAKESKYVIQEAEYALKQQNRIRTVSPALCPSSWNGTSSRRPALRRYTSMIALDTLFP